MRRSVCQVEGLLRRIAFEEIRIVFEIESAYDAPHQAGTDENLELSVEVNRIVSWSVERALIVNEVVGLFEIDLHSCLRFVLVRFARDVDNREHRDECDDAENQPETLADRAPVIEQVNFVLGVRIDAVVIRLWRLDRTIERVERRFSLYKLGSGFHVLLRHNANGQLPDARRDALDQAAQKALPRGRGHVDYVVWREGEIF